MKRFLKIMPFVLVLLLTFGMQVYLDTENTQQPFLDPFGREGKAGTMSPNRPPQVLGENRYAWLSGTRLVVSMIDPSGHKQVDEMRPLPDQDIYSRTTFQLIGDDLFWIGKGGSFKHAAWKDSKWTPTQELGTKAESLYATEAGGKRLLVAGVEDQLKVWELTAGGMKELRSFPAKRLVYVSGTVGDGNILHLGTVDQTSEANYELKYLTVDPATGRVSDLTMSRELALSSGTMVYDSSFGIDKTHGYYILTYKSNRRDNRELYAFTFPLDKPAATEPMQFEGAEQLDIDLQFSYGAYARQGQGEDLPFVFSASYAKNPRSGGYEVFRSHLQDGQWKPETTQRVSNLHAVTLNPVIYQSGEDTMILFTRMSSFSDYEVWYNTDNKEYATATNHLTSDDYLYAAMSVPKYIGIAIISLFIAMGWPVLSYSYLIYLVIKKEDEIYDRTTVHLLVSVVLYLASQFWIFFSYAKLDNFSLYAPEWMHSNGMIAAVMILMAVVSYLFTMIYAKVRYERNAIAEFSYYFAINMWMVMLGFSYFMGA